MGGLRGVLFGVAALMFPISAHAETGVALVIGNSN
jgi:hypothetical protein